jgi:hypothetical protein
MIRSKKQVWILLGSAALGFALIYGPGVALADGISIGGQDGSGQMKDLQNLATTIQNIGFNWVAKVLGGFLVIGGIMKITARDFMQGVITLSCGGALFFVQKIADSLAHMGGA